MRLKLVGIKKCDYCAEAKVLLKIYGIPYEYVDFHSIHSEQRKLVRDVQPTLPLITVSKRNWLGRKVTHVIGGYDDLHKQVDLLQFAIGGL